jgi:hypothetical protein
MKKISAASERVPRLNSLLHKLQQTPGPEDEPYLDQLMIFLDVPPDGVRDRWKKGADMCAAWGITCSGTAVYRLFRSHANAWRADFALRSDNLDEDVLCKLSTRTARLITLRVCEMLDDPASAPSTLVSLARLELARQKHLEGRRGDVERAFELLDARCRGNWEAQFALSQLRKALRDGCIKPSPFPKGLFEAFPEFPTMPGDK